ncbi:MAG: protein translocase subunit SecD [Endomicrobium sp.]|jgi:protein-export membrane protein SecD|nr:protein translocase subunit SecD [Endomicrobium sp.]
MNIIAIMNRINFKFWITVVLLILSLLVLWPSFNWLIISKNKKKYDKENTNFIFKKVLKLGLDLKGGTQLLLEIDSNKLDNSTNIEDVVNRSIEIISNRIDQFGIIDPVITKQGSKNILVQLPGIKNTAAAKSLIDKVALLEFRIVNTSENSKNVIGLLNKMCITPSQYRKNSSNYQDIKNIMPKNTSVFESKEDAKYYVLEKVLLTGESIKNAKVIFDQYGHCAVCIEFNKKSKNTFANITAKNIGNFLAIVLDDVIQSIPMIRSEILDGTAVIEGNFSPESARLLAMALRAGALPVSIKIVEERTIGPLLGADLIKKGFISSFIGIIVVFIFMTIYYRLSGIIANIALCLNFIMILAVMAYFQFTLTLPGIAGITLTLAMAVDANILILERIRDELALGKTSKSALIDGYKKSFWTIFDSNVTTIIAAFFLFRFGAGHIRGFAITLSIGLIISMFTATIVTKVIYDFLLNRKILLNIRNII